MKLLLSLGLLAFAMAFRVLGDRITSTTGGGKNTRRFCCDNVFDGNRD